MGWSGASHLEYWGTSDVGVTRAGPRVACGLSRSDAEGLFHPADSAGTKSPPPDIHAPCYDLTTNSKSEASIVRYRVLLLAAVASISTGLYAQKPAWQPAPGHTTLPVWPHAAPGAPPNLGPEIDTTTAKDNLIAGKPLIRLGNVSAPTLTLYTPTSNNTGAAVVVFPGGGYRVLAIDRRHHVRAAQVPRSRFRPLSQIRCCAPRRSARAGYRALSRCGVAYRPAPHRRPGLFRGSPPSRGAEYALRPTPL